MAQLEESVRPDVSFEGDRWQVCWPILSNARVALVDTVSGIDVHWLVFLSLLQSLLASVEAGFRIVSGLVAAKCGRQAYCRLQINGAVYASGSDSWVCNYGSSSSI